MTDVRQQLHDTEPRWFAVHTRSKSEKFVWRMLAKKGIAAYLPLQQFVRQYGRTKRVVEKPLINCYVFVHIIQNQYVSVLETENVSGFVKFNKQVVAIPEAEIALIRRVTMETGLDISASNGDLVTGDRVEISAGTLMGLRGKVVRQEGKRRFQIELATLGLQLLITVDAAFLDKLPPGSSEAFTG
jgi:transcription antitermination factor NusG